MTKLHEEFIRGRLSEVLATLRGRAGLKGECTLLIAGNTDEGFCGWKAAREDLRKGLVARSKGLSELAKEVAHLHGLPRQAAYAEAMKIKAELTASDDPNDLSPFD